MARLEAEVVAANQARTVAVAAAVSDAAVAIAAAEFSATARVSATESGAATQVEAAAAALAVAEQAGAQAREQVTTLKGELESARNTSREWETAAAEATGQVAELRDRAAGLETDRVQLTQTLTVESAALASAIEKIGVLETAVAAERASAAAAVCKHRELEAQWATDQQALDERHTAEVAARTALEAAHAQTVSELHLEGETKLHGARVEHQVRFDATQAQLASMTAQVQRMEAAATAAAHAHSQALESAAAAAAAADAQLTLTQSELQAVTAAATGAQERLVARDLVVAQLQERIEALAKLHSDARSQLDLALADATAAAERIAVLTLEVEQKSAAQTRAEHQVIELKQALAASRQECSVAAADISGLRTQVTALGSRVQDQSSKLVAETNTGHSLVHKISELEEAARVSEAARMQVVADYEMLRGLQTAAEAALRAARKEAEISAESHRASHAAAIKRGDDMEQLAVAKAAEYAAADRDRAMFAAAHHAVQAHLKALSDMHRDVVAQLAASETRGAALKQTVAEYEQLGASVSLAAVQAAASRGELEGARRKVAALELELEGTKAKAHEWEQAMHSWANERDQCYRMMGAMRAQVAFWRNRTDGSISSSSASLARAAAGPKSS
ncbi:hypothetical protein BC828DRAFT_70207 [Blastocladiella britannica]|nr:hypothetical protein BC828DRAFT_70207 [Blastocladiella britannica]